MWNDQSAVGGGFFNSPNQFGNVNTPNQASKSARRSSRTAPIVIKQALHSGDDGVKIWGTEIQIVCIVARVRNIRMQSTKITYTLQDITGRMRAVLWLDQDAADDEEKVESNNSTFATGLPANSMVGVTENSGSVNGLNPRQMMVFNLIRASTMEQGISKEDMYGSLKDRMSQVEFENILEWMCGEGHIYSTIDEEHYRATDAF
ncbi:hypothetical protein HW555_004460 [Spodoptera exigua]|uniref:Replication protein A C-terminal domain-containing protein n=1 Tax=Spodoptera exigua TaxID=7107 RepID=A0A835GLX5_SPOEX|nr:hypothetical protein HW555_004460 [Spodoptera exigua]